MDTPLEMAERLLREAYDDRNYSGYQKRDDHYVALSNALINLHYAQNGMINPNTDSHNAFDNPRRVL